MSRLQKLLKRCAFSFSSSASAGAQFFFQTYARPKWSASEVVLSQEEQATLMMLAGYGALLNCAGDPWLIILILPGLRRDCWHNLTSFLCCESAGEERERYHAPLLDEAQDVSSQLHAEASPDDPFPDNLSIDESLWSNHFSSNNFSSNRDTRETRGTTSLRDGTESISVLPRGMSSVESSATLTSQAIRGSVEPVGATEV
mmetsp:Transcript_90681/g.259079  ORF Transcript_90681/g.259079 Transcript_90681/m.259079 type:complete len:201 (-) Transcript_90681:219-821(-)